MSRAFGDLQLADSGVIAVPDVRRVSLHECTKAIAMLCSDGVWEYMTAVDAVNVATRVHAPAEAAHLIVEEAALRWSLHGEYRDDITSMLVQLVPIPEETTRPALKQTKRSPDVTDSSPFTGRQRASSQGDAMQSVPEDEAGKTPDFGSTEEAAPQGRGTSPDGSNGAAPEKDSATVVEPEGHDEMGPSPV